MGSIVPSRFLVALIATGTSTLKVVGILVALKATVTEEGRWRTHRKGKSYMWRNHIYHSVMDLHVRRNTVIHCVADPQVMEKWTSALKIVRIFVALKAMVTEEGRWRTHRKGKSYMWRNHISHSVMDPHVKGNNVIHCVADPQVMVKWTSALEVVRM